MKIEKLIDVFERLLPIYENAYRKNLDADGLWKIDLMWGLCHASYIHIDVAIFNLFESKGYYKNLIKKAYLFPEPNTSKELKPRIDFMKSEIKSLKRLQKKGYTHI